jgi:hypothetical protein
MSLEDIVRWTLLVLLFGGLLGVWVWAKRKAAALGTPTSAPGSSFKVLQKRWVDQRTGVCLVEAEEKIFLLAYTVGGGVSWQPLDKAAPGVEKPSLKPITPAPLPDPGKR